MILLVLLLAALLYFPAMRRGVGAALYGVVLVFVLTVLGGPFGALLALVVCSTMFVRGFWRPRR
jgi:hypothetical protein